MDSAELPIRRLTFYKHGVSMVEREGRLSGETLQLNFRADELNDALKSLNVLDRSEGRVLGIDYEAPAAAHRNERGLVLGAGTGMLDLMEQLVGWKVRVEIAGRSAPAEGRVTGLQYSTKHRRLRGATLMLLDERNCAVQAIAAAEVSQIVPLEGRVAEELKRFVDAGRQSAGTRPVALRLTPGDHDLSVSYLAPAPTWRVSYRVIAESDQDPDRPLSSEGEIAREDQRQGSRTSALASNAPATSTVGSPVLVGTPPASTGVLLLQGWGLFDNRFDEDLEDVAVSLVAGQPISFVYDLETSRVPPRARVEDEARVTNAPVGYAAPTLFADASDDEAHELRHLSEAPVRGAGLDIPAFQPAGSDSAASLSSHGYATALSKTIELGESFAYRVLEPVTVGRGASALVPILQARLHYRRELLFNEEKHARHPVAALRCHNDAGLVLERGPATVIENGNYRGEAIVPFTGKGASLYLPYAIELGVEIRVSAERVSETQRLTIRDGLLYEETAEIHSYRYEIVNRTQLPQALTIERSAASLPGELLDRSQPTVQVDGFYRWELCCTPGEPSHFTVRSRELVGREHSLKDMRLGRLETLLQARGLTDELRRALEPVRAEFALIEENNEQIAALENRRSRLMARQEHLRTNIGALAAGGDEGEVRLKMVRELHAAEGTLSGIEQLVGELTAENERRLRAIASTVAASTASEAV